MPYAQNASCGSPYAIALASRNTINLFNSVHRHRFSECRIFQQITAVVLFVSNWFAANSNVYSVWRPTHSVPVFSPPMLASIAMNWWNRDVNVQFGHEVHRQYVHVFVRSVWVPRCRVVRRPIARVPKTNRFPYHSDCIRSGRSKNLKTLPQNHAAKEEIRCGEWISWWSGPSGATVAGWILTS